jgi:hypothetical protein
VTSRASEKESRRKKTRRQEDCQESSEKEVTSNHP